MSDGYNYRCFAIIILFVFAGQLSHVSAKTYNEELVDSVMTMIMQFPDTISSYSVEELTRNMDQERIQQWGSVIISLKPTGIRRSIIKQYYFPLCREIVKGFYRESDIMQNLADGRDFNPLSMIHTDSLCTGRDIISRFIEYQQVCISMQNIKLSFFYGDMRFLEHFLWGNNDYIDKLDPIPEEIVIGINELFGTKTSSLEKDLLSLVQRRKNEDGFLINNASLLMEASSYLSDNKAGMLMGIICSTFIIQGKKQEVLTLIDSIMSKRIGKKWNKFKPIMIYQWIGIVDVDKAKDFYMYRDSLLSNHIEFAKYYPHQCPEKMKQHELYKEYDNKFFDTLDLIFNIGVINSAAIQLSFGNQIFINVGCCNQTEFIRLYAKETLRRYYNTGDFKIWGKIEKIKDYLEQASVFPIDIAMHIAECYVPINVNEAYRFIRRLSLDKWLDKQIENPQNEMGELVMGTAAIISYVLASNHNEAYNSDIFKYIEHVGENIEKFKFNEDVIYNVAHALSLIGKYQESNAWLSKARVDNSEKYQNFYRLLLWNHCELEEAKEALKIASKIKSLSHIDVLWILISKLKAGKTRDFEEFLSLYTDALSEDINTLPFMETEDQEWALHDMRLKVRKLLGQLNLLLATEEIYKKKENYFRPYMASIVYNWALASKGVLLRSNKLIQESVLNRMSSDDYQYYQQVLSYDDGDNQGDNPEHSLDAFVADKGKEFILDYLRKNEIQSLPQFDCSLVKEQLQPNDIAVEMVSVGNGTYMVALIRKEWKYPEYFAISRSADTDNSVKLWSAIKPYLADNDRIFISLDGEYIFDNIEMAVDSAGICMADKYQVYRLSSTLNIPKDVYISDLESSVLYGNLRYADSNENYDEVALNENAKRGAVNDSWEPLSDTKEELELIIKVLSNANIPHIQYQGTKGTKDSFMALNRQNISLLHLATHGFYNAENIEGEDEIPAMKRSGIVFANSEYDLSYKKNSGSVFANEISNMDLGSIKLLVLSACDTAKGDLDDDGVFGLQRGFKQAGVGCIIMSLKEVNSVMTTELMQLFYSFFAKGQTARLAFRNAQKQIALKYKIDDWKAFIIID